MVQKEVANRLTAECGSKDYGITSIFLATMGEAQVLFDIGKENFKPVPKVDSSVIMVEFNRTTDEILDYHIFVNLVRGTFQTRRKKIKNSLDRIIGASNTARIRSIDLNCRPENLSPDEFKVLANEVYSFSN
jgi:16S rRNA (adenine1518-N6/adenine1519-N6)-dimethyltransferase